MKRFKKMGCGLPVRGTWYRRIMGIVLALVAGIGCCRSQIVSFSLSASGVAMTGWVNVAGDPSTGIRTATSSGITISSVSPLNWSPVGGVSARNGSGVGSGSYMPSTVMANNWFMYNGAARSLALYNFAAPQLELSGLNPDSTYNLRISGSDTGSLNANPTQYSVAGRVTFGSRNLTIHNNAASGVVFTGVAPDAFGVIRIYVNATAGTDLAAICGIQVYSGSSSIGSPTVNISAPTNGQLVAEGDNVTIKATAVETGASISKVEFYADTTKIGEVDTAPYTLTWTDPDPGVYTLTVQATDNTGTVASTSLAIDVNSLNYFWSITGNADNNPDSNFVGNVDSVRMDFRTKNIQRMSIGVTGNIGIGTISPTAQLHTAGSVRFAGLVSDSAYNRLLVVDASGNLAYRSVAPVGQSVDNGLSVTGSDSVSLGDSVAGPTSRSFGSNRYQHLNGHFYSIGGSVDSPVNMPVFRWYNNGDLVSGTTMDRSVNTLGQTGLRYYNKFGTLELGASDRLDTTRSKTVTGTWPWSGLLVNSDDSNKIKSPLLNSIVASHDMQLDSGAYIKNSLVGMASGHLLDSMQQMTNSLVAGASMAISAPVINSILAGSNHTYAHPISDAGITGFLHTPMDTVTASLVGGGGNVFGGEGQLVSGQQLYDFSPYGTMIGNSSAFFSALSFTGTRGTNVSGLAGYPLFVLGNSSNNLGFGASNALTVMYNGRTQINTTGFGTNLTATQVTPKAALEVASTNSGVLFPLLTTAQETAIASGDLYSGLLLYNSDAGNFQVYNGSGWMPMGAPGGITNEWDNIGNTSTSPSTNFAGTTDSEPFVFRTHNATRMTITSSGLVGIGTTAPQTGAKLAVDGTIYAQKVEATQTGWPDYVFGRGYRLFTLDSLGRYIRRYGHLPGVPQALAVESGGLDLGDNQAVLLQKVEEMTLYLIAANKQTAGRQKEIDALNAVTTRLGEQQRELAELKRQVEEMLRQKAITK